MNIWRKVSNQIGKTRTSILVNVCFLVGLSCILPLSFFQDTYEGIWRKTLVSLMFFFWGLGGLPMVLRQDADFGLFRIEGMIAVLLGIMVIVIGFSLAVYFFW